MKMGKKQIIITALSTTLLIGSYFVAANYGFFGGGTNAPSVPEDTMTRGLAGYWEFEEGTGQVTYDGSENSNNGTLGAAATAGSDDPKWGAGKNGGALNLDGVNDYVFKSDSTSLSITGDLTIESWIKLNATSKEQTIIGKWDETTATDDRSYRIWIDSSNKLNLSVTTDGSTVVTHTGTTTTFAANTWYHIMGVYDNAGTMDVYVNGALDATQKAAGVPASIDDNVSDFFMGTKENTSGSNDTLFNGIIDSVRIYNRALTADEVRYHYNRGGPVGAWNFDEGSGAVARDETENNNDITLVGTPSWVSGKYGSALDLESSSSQYGYKADTASLSITNDLTISAWIKPESTAAATLFDIAGKWDYISSVAVESYLLAQYEDEIRLSIDAAANYKTTDSANLIAGNWYHIEGVYNAATQTVNIYVNGILQAGTVAGTIPASIGDDAARFHIGAEDSSTAAANFYDGLVDSVRVYAYARAADEIRLDYNAGYAAHLGPSGKTCAQDPASCMDNGLVGYWNMDEGGASAAKDSSSGSNNGALTNGPFWTKGKKGNAIKFDGVNDYVLIGDVYNGVKSVSFWMKAGNTTQNILDLNGTDYIQVSAGAIATTGAGWVSPTIYVDGKEATTIDTVWRYITITTATGVNASAINLAKFSTNYFNGILDEVRIYNRALSFEEINYLYNEKKPVGQWDFDEGAGATAHDSQGNLDITFPVTESERPTWTTP